MVMHQKKTLDYKQGVTGELMKRVILFLHLTIQLCNTEGKEHQTT